ncbi:MAG: 5-formyltetrahydrofolate cyclo-ligase [Phycisphaerales bacterium]|nr:5-formyltetrahydrofolate cyclo-ligase [Phycisphaerales bacterium]
MNTTSTKKELRNAYKIKRYHLAINKKQKYDAQLLEQIKTLNFADCRILLNFYPIDKYQEPNTFIIRDYLLSINPQMKIAYPITKIQDKTMNAIYQKDITQFKENTESIGMMEPLPGSGEWIHPTEIDVVIVPLLIFDTKGYRVGMGKGFYDRYLKLCSKKCKFIGISYFDPVPKIEDIHDLDVPLHCCVTPNQVYVFS